MKNYWSASMHCTHCVRLPVFSEIHVGKSVVAVKLLCPEVLPTNDDKKIFPCCSVSVINNRACNQHTMRYSCTCINFITDILFIWTAAQLVWTDNSRCNYIFTWFMSLFLFIWYVIIHTQVKGQQHPQLSFKCATWQKNNQQVQQ